MPNDRFVSSRWILMLAAFLAGGASPITPTTAASLIANETYGRLPLHFEANRGQTHEDVRFLARGPGYSLYLTAGEAVLVLARPNPDAKRDAHSTPERLNTQAREAPVVVRMSLMGAAPKPRLSGLEELPGVANQRPDLREGAVSRRLSRHRRCLLRQPAPARVRLRRRTRGGPTKDRARLQRRREAGDRPAGRAPDACARGCHTPTQTGHPSGHRWDAARNRWRLRDEKRAPSSVSGGRL